MPDVPARNRPHDASPAPHPRILDVTGGAIGDASRAEAIEAAAAIIRAGGLVAFPTETVYGLGANALDRAAVARIFAAKGRPSFNPVIVHIADASGLERVATRVPPIAAQLAQAFWPGPLTLLLPRRPQIPDVVTAGLDAVGVRVPAHPVARALIVAAGVPIAAPSANAYTRTSPTTAAHVVAQLGDKVDLVLDGGACEVGIESTVLDVTGESPVLMRLGGVSRAALEAVIGPVATVGRTVDEGESRPSPGMVERHYAPNAKLVAFDGEGLLPAQRSHAARDAAWKEIAALAAQGERVGLIAFDTDGAPAAVAITMPRDAAGYARGLYAALHLLDRERCSVAYIERPPAAGDWEAIADRLRRAGLPAHTA